MFLKNILNSLTVHGNVWTLEFNSFSQYIISDSPLTHPRASLCFAYKNWYVAHSVQITLLIKLWPKQTCVYYQIKSSKPATKVFTPYKEEIMAFFRIILAMGTAKLVAMPDYWRKGITFMPWFGSIMFCTKL